jgi:hypothetical protein
LAGSTGARIDLGDFVKFFRTKKPPTESATATKVTPLANGDDVDHQSDWKYTEVEEPERFSPVPHELGMVVQSFESFECEVFERVDAIHAAGGLDLGHFDLFDGYLARERESVEASLVHEREDRRKTAARLTAIFHKRTVSESLRVRPLRAEYDQLSRLRDEVVSELCGREHVPAAGTDLVAGLPVPKPVAIVLGPDSDAVESSSIGSVDDQVLRPVRDPRPEVKTSVDHDHRPFKESS